METLPGSVANETGPVLLGHLIHGNAGVKLLTIPLPKATSIAEVRQSGMQKEKNGDDTPCPAESQTIPIRVKSLG